VGSLTIGIPAFFLSLAPNTQRYVPGFVRRVAGFTIPAGFVAAGATFGAYALAREQPGVSLDEARTTAALVLLVIGLWVLVILARPLTPWRGLLMGAMVAAFALALLVPAGRDFYALELPRETVLVEVAVIAGGAAVLLEVGWRMRSRAAAAGQRVGARVRASRGA
jgi:cation-transporting ATPase E